MTQDRDHGEPEGDAPRASRREGAGRRNGAARAAARGISPDTLREAEKLAALELRPDERAQILPGLAELVDHYERRRRVAPRDGDGLLPATTFDPRLPGMSFPAEAPPLLRTPGAPPPLPERDEDIGFAPLTSLSRWIESRQLESRRLTQIYLDRLRAFGPRLECVVTLAPERALRAAERADAELAAGRYRGPLHGIPWGAKDLLDTAGLRTTWGATPFRERVPGADAAVVARLDAAGAVLAAKLTLGALAYGDLWFDGRTRNPWNPAQGSSGSSAGSAAAIAAGLVGFSIGSETLGSIVSPCMRCGTTGLRPTFGRVPRTGAMLLCASMDRLGPICRSVEDTALVLDAIAGPDGVDPTAIDLPFAFDATGPIEGRRVGYAPAWFESSAANDVDRAALEALRRTGVTLVERALPDLPYGALLAILRVEAAASFDDLTRSGGVRTLRGQDDADWPSLFRQGRFVPAVELVQAERFRRRVMEELATCFDGVDALVSPSYAGPLFLVTSFTGHPSLTLRAGFLEGGQPHGITLWGRLFDEGGLCRIGMALEAELGVRDRRPAL